MVETASNGISARPKIDPSSYVMLRTHFCFKQFDTWLVISWNTLDVTGDQLSMRLQTIKFKIVEFPWQSALTSGIKPRFVTNYATCLVLNTFEKQFLWKETESKQKLREERKLKFPEALCVAVGGKRCHIAFRLSPEATANRTWHHCRSSSFNAFPRFCVGKINKTLCSRRRRRVKNEELKRRIDGMGIEWIVWNATCIIAVQNVFSILSFKVSHFLCASLFHTRRVFRTLAVNILKVTEHPATCSNRLYPKTTFHHFGACLFRQSENLMSPGVLRR